MNRRCRATAAAMALLATGCVNGSYSHISVDEPVPSEWLAALQLGTDTLGTCLGRLGAPHRVFEYQVGPDRTSGMALLWFWRDAAGWGVQVSAGAKDISGSVSFDQLSTDLPGCMLWFGPDLVLQKWRAGRIGDLLKGRVRPSRADQD
jgi:hypothetical protein